MKLFPGRKPNFLSWDYSPQAQDYEMIGLTNFAGNDIPEDCQ
jgi:hypothetical protein